jgi:hypothetical protein
MGVTVTADRNAYLPPELWYEILTKVLAESMHRIGTSPELSYWDRDVVGILSGVCFLWREIVGDILTKVLAIDRTDGSTGEEDKR